MLGKFSRCQATGYLALHKSRVWSSRKMRKARLCPRAEQTDRGEYEYSLTKKVLPVLCHQTRRREGVGRKQRVCEGRGRTLGDSEVVPCSML